MSVNTYDKMFYKGPESALPQQTTDGVVRFTTDTGRMFIEGQNNTRTEITDFIKGMTEEEIKAQFAPLTNKIYIASDTNKFMIYDTTQDDWTNVAVVDVASQDVIIDITRVGFDFIGTKINGSTFSFNQQQYTGTNGISINNTTISNSGVRSIATGTSNGTINVNTNGTTSDIAIKGLAALAYKDSLDKSDVGLGNVANLDQSKAIKSITRSGTTFTATAIDGSTSSFTQQDNNTTYTGANGVSLSGTTFSNSGVRSIATGASNGTINVNTNGTTANVAVKGLGSAAYTESSAYAPASHTHSYAGSSSAGGVANSANKLYEASTNVGGYASSDSHILKLGYFNCSYSYDNLTLLITSAFWGNQHGSADIINIQQDLSNNGSGSIQHTIRRLHIGGSYNRTFYYKNDNTNKRVYLYVYVSGGNSYGRWNISTIQDSGTTAFVRELASNQSSADLVQIANTFGDSVYSNASTAATANTLALRDPNGYLYATYYNTSSNAENPSTASYIMYCNSDGWLRKSSLANVKSILGLGSAAYTNSTAYAAASHTHSYLPLSGGTLTGQILTSFKSSVAMGSYQPSATTIPDLLTELRYSSGCAGSFTTTAAYTKDGVTAPATWYNFIYLPHRSGGVNGSASGDNCNYGTLLFTGMTSDTGYFTIRFSGGGISSLRKLANNSDISALQSNFQAGVDSVYNAIVAKGTTPASKSLSDVVTAIGNICTNASCPEVRWRTYNSGSTPPSFSSYFEYGYSFSASTTAKYFDFEVPKNGFFILCITRETNNASGVTITVTSDNSSATVSSVYVAGTAELCYKIISNNNSNMPIIHILSKTTSGTNRYDFTLVKVY